MAPLLEVRNLTVAFDTPGGTIHAVNDVSYTLEEGETLGVVGESGSGKSVHVLAMCGLIARPPGRIVSGEVLFRGRDLLRLSERELRDIRGGEIGFVFQDPMTSLNPVLTVERQLVEILRRHRSLDTRQARGPGDRASGDGAHSRCGPAHRPVSASVLGRHAPARHDRDWRRLPAEAADRR